MVERQFYFREYFYKLDEENNQKCITYTIGDTLGVA